MAFSLFALAKLQRTVLTTTRDGRPANCMWRGASGRQPAGHTTVSVYHYVRDASRAPVHALRVARRHCLLAGVGILITHTVPGRRPAGTPLFSRPPMQAMLPSY